MSAVAASIDLAASFAELSCARDYDDLSRAAAESTKAFILDTLGAAIAGSSADGIAPGLALIREHGGAPQAPVLVYGDRLPAPAVALINGTMCQARDFDPVYEPGVMLPYGPTVAAAWSAAALAGSDGKQFIYAVAAGTDLACRIGKSVVSGLGWSRSATLGVFGAALASAVLLGLDRDKTLHALGLALSRSSGNIQTVIDGSLAKRYQGGFAAEAGLMAALLAQRGVTGPRHVFEGRCGYYALYESGRYHRERALDALGERYEGTEASIKPYPCAREHHGAISSALKLVAEGVVAAEIDAVRVLLPPNAHLLSGKPYRQGQSHSIGDAIGSAAYAVATALVRGEVTLAAFQSSALVDPEVVALADRVVVEVDPAVTDTKTLVPQTVAVTLRNGAVRRAVTTGMPGSPAAPLTPKELDAKFSRCLDYRAEPLDAPRASALLDRLHALEQIERIADLAT